MLCYISKSLANILAMSSGILFLYYLLKLLISAVMPRSSYTAELYG